MARPCARPARSHHRAALRDRRRAPARPDGEGSGVARLRAHAARARAGYHERWLAHLRDPGAPHHRPRLSCIVAVRDRPTLAAEAVASALEQTWGPSEVVVIDDGSRDRAALQSALRPFAGRVTLVHQENQGVSAARNHGLRLVRGELVHFLDSDNHLHPDAAEHWMAAFAAVPDAGVCFSPTEAPGPDGGPPRRTGVPTGGPDCPTRDLLAVCAASYPFNLGGAALPRWVMLNAGGFDPALRHYEDTRLWFVLGLAGIKAIGLRRPFYHRGFPDDRLTADASASTHAAGLVWLMAVTDLIRRPRCWSHVGAQLDQLCWPPRWRAVEHDPDADMESRRAALLHAVADLGAPLRGRAPRARRDALLAACEQAAERWAYVHGDDGEAGAGRFAARWRDAVRAARAGTASPSARGPASWWARAPRARGSRPQRP